MWNYPIPVALVPGSCYEGGVLCKDKAIFREYSPARPLCGACVPLVCQERWADSWGGWNQRNSREHETAPLSHAHSSGQTASGSTVLRNAARWSHSHPSQLSLMWVEEETHCSAGNSKIHVTSRVEQFTWSRLPYLQQRWRLCLSMLDQAGPLSHFCLSDTLVLSDRTCREETEMSIIWLSHDYYHIWLSLDYHIWLLSLNYHIRLSHELLPYMGITWLPYMVITRLPYKAVTWTTTIYGYHLTTIYGYHSTTI